ncbi:hypothetical protein [Aquitalea palustris]|uniref:hypothetical protein n=1 Tax=Aquitalea palustris TaxID=2480983 RepID=UPI0018EE27D1|nr:hypothetical protein [Aquitalea palustris]
MSQNWKKNVHILRVFPDFFAEKINQLVEVKRLLRCGKAGNNWLQGQASCP